MRYLLILLVFGLHSATAQHNILVLGIAQDGGFPHAGCEKTCCQTARQPGKNRYVTSLAVVDSVNRSWWLVEATPDISDQLHLFDSLTRHYFSYLPQGILITHAHIGHYTGLMHLGKEVMGASMVPVYCLPRMASFLRSNGPWSQLVSQKNIEIREIESDTIVHFSNNVSVKAILVPHRDEFSETCGFSFDFGKLNYLFIPDIDKWEKWHCNLVKMVSDHYISFLDGTFSDSAELPGRNMKEVPHPFITESISLIEDREFASRVHFIHFNHTNKAMWDDKARYKMLMEFGIMLTEQGDWY